MTSLTSVVLAGGGTAGHVSPLIATAGALRRVHSGRESCNACVPVRMHSAGSSPRGAAPLALPANGLAYLGNRSRSSRFWYRPQAKE